MINFVVSNGCYKNVIKSFIQPIIPYLDDYSLEDKAVKGAVNVIFFTEDGVFKKVAANTEGCINVFMTHGIADKNWRSAQKVDKFDYVLVSGDLWIDKLIEQGLPKDKIRLGGYTRLDSLYNLKDDYVKTIDNGKRTILFAPTHTCSVTSYGQLNNIMDMLKNKYNVIESAHPSQNNKMITQEMFLEADVIVGDFGSSMYESWTLGKPCVLPNWLVKKDIHNLYPNTFEDRIYQEEIDYHAKSEEDFINKIELACKYGITQGAVDFIDGIFNKELRGNGGEVTAEILREIESKEIK